MLSPQAISTALDQVQNFENRGAVVRPLAGSVLDSLVKACHVDYNGIYRREDGSYPFVASDIACYANSKDSITDNCEHTLCESELATKIAGDLIRHISFARTVVAPAVEHFVKNLDDALQVYRGQIAHDFEITTQALPAPLSEASILDSVEKFGTVVVTDSQLPRMILGLKEGGLELIRTGSTSVDAGLENWVASLNTPKGSGEDFVTGVFGQLFGGNTNPGTVSIASYFNDSQEGLDRLLVAFLITRKMWDNPPEGAKISLSTFNDIMSELRNQIAARLMVRIKNSERLEKSGSLVLSSFGKKIVVNQPVYVKWLKAGGSNEVLFGNALLGVPETLVEKIDANSEASLRAWDRYAAIKQVEFQNRMFTRFKEMAAVEFQRTMAAATHEEMPMQEREQIARRFSNALNTSKVDEIKDLYLWGLRLLATSWFYKTDSYRILKDVCDIRAANPRLDVREAAAVATINYIAYWVASQMQLVRPGNNT